MKKPTYYVAVFGKPEPPDKDTPDSGRFFLGIRGADTPAERGDILLLYSTSGPAGNAMNAPGIGVVLTKTKEFIFYTYLPFLAPLSMVEVAKAFTDEDRKKLNGIGSNTYWLLDISRGSFVDATRDASIDWP